MKTTRKLLAILCTVAILFSSLTMGTVFAADTATAVDYSSITFDTENGTTGNMSSSKWSFYDASENAIGGNATKMLKVKTDGTTNFGAWLLADGNYVQIESGKSYSLSFEYYADAGVNLSGITVRDSSAIVTDKSDSSGLIPVSKLDMNTENGTGGEWKKIKVYFTADETVNLKVGITPKTATSDVFMYFDNYSLTELPSETAGDYSNITFDTANGNGGDVALSNTKEYWSFYDALDGIDGNYSRMLKLVPAKAASQLNAKLLYGEEQVSITEGITYRLDFEIYADAGLDIKNFVIRNSANSGIITSISDKWGAHTAAALGLDANGTNGKWKKVRIYITAAATTTLNLSFMFNTAATDKYMYFDNFSLVEIPTETAEDYSNVNYDTANGTAFNLNSGVWSFYDAVNGIAGNNTRMLKLYTGKSSGLLATTITYGADAVPLVEGERYRLEFDYYAESGIDYKETTIRSDAGHIKTDVLPIGENGTNGEWKHQIVYFTAIADSTILKFGITTNSTSESYMYFDNFSLTSFDSEAAITFEGKTNGSAVDSSTSVWRYTNANIAGNDTTKLVFSHTGQAVGTIYNDFDEKIAIDKGYYYIIKFDYYADAYTGSLGAVYNNDIGYKCNLDITSENGTGGVWKTATTVLKTTGSTEQFKLAFNPTNTNGAITVYFDNISIAMLYDCSMEAPEIESITPNSITVVAVEGYEYSVDGVHFTTNATFNNLYSETGIYPVYCREVLTDNGYPSAASEAIYVQLPFAGDINNDKLLNADDLVQVRGKLLGVESEKADSYFDSNRDTKVDIRDIVNLKKKIADKFEITTATSVVKDGTTYTLAWNDDFIGSYIDRNNWANRESSAESEYQYFQNGTNNLFIDNDVDGNSCIVLQAVNETVNANGRTYDYTSGGIDTYGKFSFNRGYVEMRAKLPRGAGLWSGFWFGGTSNRDGDSNWPENGEIDIFEHYGYKADTLFHNFHYATYDSEGNIVANKIRDEAGEYETVIDGNFYDEFHTFGCEWTDEYVAYYVDGVLTNKYVKDSETFASINEEDMYLLVTLAVGGSDEAMADIGNTEFPAQMAVDYVRYYK